MRHSQLLVLSGALLAAACAPGGQQGGASDSTTVAMSPSQSAGWEALFDGTGLARWRGFRRPDVPGSWSVQDGTLAFRPSADQAQRGDIVTRDQYGDFELELEWKISEGGNSGIIYRATEDEPQPWRTGPEMQVLDDARHSDGKIPSHRAGALYDLVVPPEGVTRPVGEWNRARIVVRGNRIQQWLNGTQTADVEIGSEDWNRRMAQSKFREMPAFATKRAGHVVLQDHSDPVWYRNIRIRRLDTGR
jgi:hypothetical protein